MAINCGAPAFKVSSRYLLNDVRPRLIELVREIEEGLGQRAPEMRSLRVRVAEPDIETARIGSVRAVFFVALCTCAR